MHNNGTLREISGNMRLEIAGFTYKMSDIMIMTGSRELRIFVLMAVASF